MFADTRLRLSKLLETGYTLDTFIYKNNIYYALGQPSEIMFASQSLGDTNYVNCYEKDMFHIGFLAKSIMLLEFKATNTSTLAEMFDKTQTMDAFLNDFGFIIDSYLDEAVEIAWRKYKKDIE